MIMRPFRRGAGTAVRRVAGSGRMVCGPLAAWAVLVVVPSAAVGQVQFQLQQMMQPMIAPFVPPGEAAEDAIGDPWWDDAEAGRPAAKPQPEAAGEAQVEEPADAQEMLQAQLRAQVEMLAQSVRQQGLAILRRELSLVRQACPSLEKQQRALVLEAGRGAIDRVVNEQTQVTGRGRRRPARQTNLETTIRDALKASVKANADDAELAAYEAEHRLREERRKAAVVAAIVAEVDREAYLDDAERAALAKGLVESYRERWRPAVVALQQNGVAVPDESLLPGLERCVEKALGKERKAQWVAARDEARKLAAGAGMEQGQVLFGNGGVQVQAQVMAAPGRPAVRRVIRRQVRVGGNGVQMQLEVQAGAAVVEEAEAEEAGAAPAEEQK